MNRDDFLLLDEEEQAAFLLAEEGKEKELEDLRAERDSLKNDYEDLAKKNNDLAAENQRVKATNYSLTRQIKTHDGGTRQDPEEIIHSMFTRRGND